MPSGQNVSWPVKKYLQQRGSWHAVWRPMAVNICYRAISVSSINSSRHRGRGDITSSSISGERYRYQRRTKKRRKKDGSTRGISGNNNNERRFRGGGIWVISAVVARHQKNNGRGRHISKIWRRQLAKQ